MKVGLFATWLSQSRGGIENMCFNVFSQFRKTCQTYAFSLKVDERDNISENVFYASTAKRTVPVFQYLKAYRREHKKGRFDINIAMHAGTGIVALIIKLLMRVPYIVFVHGKEVYCFESIVHKIIYNAVIRNADKVLTNSGYTASQCGAKYAGKVVVAHPGINDEIVSKAADEAVGRSFEGDGIIRLFTVSRLVRRKGIDTAIKAVKELTAKGCEVEYVIAGSGEYEQELRELADAIGMSEQVKFTGRVSEEEKAGYYQNCDLFVMPSFDIPEENEIEGFGIVYIEANAFGRFVIAGDSGGIPDAVKHGETGCLVDGKDPNAVAAAILEYMDKPADEKELLVKKCKEWALEHDWSKLIERWFEALKGIV